MVGFGGGEESCLTGCSRIRRERGMLSGQQRQNAVGDEALPERYRFQAMVLHNLLRNTGWNSQQSMAQTVHL